jgi:hypothetical protein
LLKSLGENHPNVAVVRNNLKVAWQEKDEHDKTMHERK